MNKSIPTILLAGVSVLIVSLALLYGLIYLAPALMEEYYNPVFRSSSFKTDWLFYVHPFVLSAALYWFWGKGTWQGSSLSKAITAGVTYGVVAMVPVLFLTFSAIDISALMVITWFVYGVAQAVIACYVFAARESK